MDGRAYIYIYNKYIILLIIINIVRIILLYNICLIIIYDLRIFDKMFVIISNIF